MRRLSRRTRPKVEGIDREWVAARVGQLADETISALAARLFADPPGMTSAEVRDLLRMGAAEAELREYAEFCDEVAAYWTTENKWDLLRGLRHYDLPELQRTTDLSAAPDEVKELCRWLLRGPLRIRAATINPVRRGALRRVADGRGTAGAVIVADIAHLRLVCDRPERPEGAHPRIEDLLDDDLVAPLGR